jgi:hypothetical protein
MSGFDDDLRLLPQVEERVDQAADAPVRRVEHLKQNRDADVGELEAQQVRRHRQQDAVVDLGEQHPRLRLLNQADRQEWVTGGVDKLEFLNVVEEVDRDGVAVFVAGDVHAVLGFIRPPMRAPIVSMMT